MPSKRKNELLPRFSCSVISGSYFWQLVNATVIAIIIYTLYFFAREFDLLPQYTVTTISLPMAFVLGIIASTSTCMATSGALFLATIGKFQHHKLSFWENIVPAISFNAGRIITYGIFGYLTGMVGQVISSDLQMGSYLSLFVAIMMILIGLSMLKLLPVSSLFFTNFSKRIYDRVEAKLLKFPKRTSFILGVLTYLLPCGFTQTVQMYALGLADPMQSMLVMVLFALGTTPALMAIAFASSATRSRIYTSFYHLMGALIFVIGVIYFSNFMTLYGININPLASIHRAISYAELEEGHQTIEMNVDGEGYSPNIFTIKKGVPVKWVINGANVFGCQGFLVSPKLGIQKTLQDGENIVEFIPKEKGSIAFSCSLGIFKGSFNVI